MFTSFICGICVMISSITAIGVTPGEEITITKYSYDENGEQLIEYQKKEVVNWFGDTIYEEVIVDSIE